MAKRTPPLFRAMIFLLFGFTASCSAPNLAETIKHKNINDLTEGEKAFIRLGIQKMRLREITHTNNWIYQSNNHGYPKKLVNPAAGCCTYADLENESCEFHAYWVQSDLVFPINFALINQT